MIDESLPPDTLVKTKWDWEWMAFKDSMKLRWIPQGDGTFELHLLVRPVSLPYLVQIVNIVLI